jgi:hypothetical protein
MAWLEDGKGGEEAGQGLSQATALSKLHLEVVLHRSLKDFKVRSGHQN